MKYLWHIIGLAAFIPQLNFGKKITLLRDLIGECVLAITFALYIYLVLFEIVGETVDRKQAIKNLIFFKVTYIEVQKSPW